MSRRLVVLLYIISALLGSGFTRDTSTPLTIAPALSPALAPGASAGSAGFESASAFNRPPGPDRYAVTTVEYTAYEWWLVSWREEQVVCSVIADHEGVPTLHEVYRDCGQSIYETWITQKPCIPNSENDPCEGYYIHQIDNKPDQKEIVTPLAPATAWISVEGCEPVPLTSTNICDRTPILVVTGREPLPTERIIRVEGLYNEEPFACDRSDTCKLPLHETGLDGVPVEFWAHSSYGDSSPSFQAKVRVSKVVDEGSPDQFHWYVDVLSSQWLGQPAAICADWWGSFPPVGGPPAWLTSPARSEDLATDIPYNYLASNLIAQGLGNTIACSNGGLDPGGGANQCGLENARQAVDEWQNRFDQIILTVAKETGVSAYLLKNLFARESQFWPGHSPALGETGLGHLTEEGADATLSWNSSFYEQFCPRVLIGERCSKGYLHLQDNERLLLRQSLVASINATCAECPLGLDIAKADSSVNIFAQTLLANCRQTGQVVRNFTGDTPGASVSYQDLWKLTLVNYNAGPGCLAAAISGARLHGLELTWENISPHLSPACAPAIDYILEISKEQ